MNPSLFPSILKKNGVTAETVVGIMMEPSVDLLVVLIAILKAGGAYLPIDPGLPEERILYMLKDSGAKWLLFSRQASSMSHPSAVYPLAFRI